MYIIDVSGKSEVMSIEHKKVEMMFWILRLLYAIK